MKKVFIIILNYNGYEDTKMCLESIHKLNAKNTALSTIVIDNGSQDGSLKKLKSQNFGLKNLIFLVSGSNVGFAKGNNIAMEYAKKHGADYILILNNDTIVEKNFLESLLAIDSDIASPVVKFRQFKESKDWLYDYGGYVNWWTGRTTHLNKSLQPTNYYLQPIKVDYVAGCCMLIKRRVWEKIGFFDEAYFIYFEDVDYCITAKKKGFQVVVDPKTYIYHKLGGSMDRWSKRAIYYNLLGNFIFITKHLGLRRLTGYFYLGILALKIIKDRTMRRLA